MRPIPNWKEDEKQGLLEKLVEDMRWDSQREVLGILSQTLTKKRNLKLFFGTSMPHANVRTTTIKIPHQIYPNPFIDWILKKGVTLHESYHIMFTGNAKERVDKFINEVETKGKPFRFNLLKNIINVLEDVRIEYLGVNEYKGSSELLGFINAFFYKVAKLEKQRLQQDLLYSLCFELKGYKTTYIDRKLMDKLIKVGKKVVKQDFNGMLETAIKIYKILDEDLPQVDLDKLASQYFQNKQSNRGFESKMGQVQNFDKRGRRDKSKLTKEEVKKIEDELENIRNDFEEMFDNDEETEDTQEDKDEQDQEESGKSEGSEQENTDEFDDEKGVDTGDDTNDNDDTDEKDSTDISKGSGSGDDSDKEGEDDDGVVEDDEEPLFEDVFDEETTRKIMKRFEEEKKSHEKIEKQIRERGDQQTKQLEKEFDDSFQSGLTLHIPKKGYSSPFDQKEVESVATMIADELRNKIIIGKTKITQQTSGKLNLKSAVRSFTNYEITGEFDSHIYERDVIDTPEHAVLISIDCSSSMLQIPDSSLNKSRLSYAKEVLFVLAKVFESLDVKFSIRGFHTDSDFLVKGWEDEFDSRRLMGLSALASTPTAEATDIAFKRMQDVDDDLKIIFTITDGEPDREYDTKNVVDMCKENGVLVFGIFYGASKNRSNESSLKYVYGEGNFIMTDSAEELKNGMVKLYEKILKKSSYGTTNGNGWG